MKNRLVKCFGTGDGWPCADRNHSSFLFRFGKTSVLIDCGEPIDRSYKASGLSHDLIDAIFLSHLHADHFGGFFMFIQGLWLEGRRKELPVYLPAGAVRPVREMLKAGLMFKELLPYGLNFLPLGEGQPRAVGDVSVTPFRTSHLDGFRRRFRKQYRSTDFNAYCFLLECGRIRVGHSADLGCPEDLDPLLSKPLDLLVCEIGHFSPEQLFGYLAGRDIKRAVFVHLARPFRANMGRIRKLAARMLPTIPHTFAQDLDEIAF
jgi:ribonuclease BN (tRNA processing enzyme)